VCGRRSHRTPPTSVFWRRYKYLAQIILLHGDPVGRKKWSKKMNKKVTYQQL